MFTPNEPHLLSRYLLKVTIGSRESQLYSTSIQNSGFELSDFERQLFAHLIQHPFYIAAYDTILSLIWPQSHIRKRLYLMFSILETSPAHADHFLGVHGRFACVRIAIVGVSKYLMYLVVGTLLYSFQRTKYHLCR